MQTEGKPGEKPWVNWNNYFSCWQVEIDLFRCYVSAFFWDYQLQVWFHHGVIDLSGLIYNLDLILQCILGFVGGLLPTCLKFSSIWRHVLEDLGVPLKQKLWLVQDCPDTRMLWFCMSLVLLWPFCSATSEDGNQLPCEDTGRKVGRDWLKPDLWAVEGSITHSSFRLPWDFGLNFTYRF